MMNNFYEPHVTRPIKSAARGEQRSILLMEPKPLAAFVIACFIGLAILFHFDDASAQEAEVIAGGELEYQKYCAVCHGVDARGGGIMAKFLTLRPADLTQIATRNGGTFPFWQIYRVIDGGEVRGHGSRDMPIWGDRFRTQAGGNDPGSRAQAAGRLLGLVFYLQHIQQ
jgi:mono/diheme cytochrome c family protein